MRSETIKVLCCPQCKGELTFKNEVLIKGDYTGNLYCSECKNEYNNTGDYPDFLGDKGLTFSSRREEIVRSVYAKVYTPVNNFLFLFCGGARNARNEVLSHLDLEYGSSVLETGMGTGDNLLWINNKVKNLLLYGIDIQKQMMIHSMRNLRKWSINAELFRADAVELPFKNESFDVVFHLGAINLFSDKRKAIDEMIRVSKPGKRIVIADETDKASKFFNFFTGEKIKVVPPVDLIPEDMLDIKLKIIWKGFGYLITFTKP